MAQERHKNGVLRLRCVLKGAEEPDDVEVVLLVGAVHLLKQLDLNLGLVHPQHGHGHGHSPVSMGMDTGTAP